MRIHHLLLFLFLLTGFWNSSQAIQHPSSDSLVSWLDSHIDQPEDSTKVYQALQPAIRTPTHSMTSEWKASLFRYLGKYHKMYENYMHVADCYEHLGNLKQALVYQKKYSDTYDGYLESIIERMETEAQVKYENRACLATFLSIIAGRISAVRSGTGFTIPRSVYNSPGICPPEASSSSGTSRFPHKRTIEVLWPPASFGHLKASQKVTPTVCRGMLNETNPSLSIFNIPLLVSLHLRSKDFTGIN